MIYPQLKTFCDSLPKGFENISDERKITLQVIANYIQAKQKKGSVSNLIYVCTHNSRRSHFGQVWASVAAQYYNIKNVRTFSGGTEVTAFNHNAIIALESQGFIVRKVDEDMSNPKFNVYYTDELYNVCFSKMYNHEQNPNENFAAIMTCGSAEANCPYIPNCELRVATTYLDPKISDNTAQQEETYYNRSKEIATEIFYVFSLLKND